ncbi:hypothetical protein GCM10007276_18770 [Agaricicola taiwanensis]|uniref:Uncharacterized protein n=2 Tax=Agaricicola taiwanensis TaxID=591372 RepID=A0A8J2YGV0_9RHOB|nr:hypothetical protein GCM10007276_18770 [Agaricicola taiwanensis]
MERQVNQRAESQRRLQAARGTQSVTDAPPKVFDRVICTRVCDGARMVMAIRPSDRDHDNYLQMCSAAGNGEITEMTVERLGPVVVADLAASKPLFSGRSSSPAAASSCGGRINNLSVPIFADTTLRRGDIVALNGGFKVFIGRGEPPFTEADFKTLGEKDMAKGLRGMKVAGGEPM